MFRNSWCRFPFITTIQSLSAYYVFELPKRGLMPSMNPYWKFIWIPQCKYVGHCNYEDSFLSHFSHSDILPLCLSLVIPWIIKVKVADPCSKLLTNIPRVAHFCVTHESWSLCHIRHCKVQGIFVFIWPFIPIGLTLLLHCTQVSFLDKQDYKAAILHIQPFRLKRLLSCSHILRL